MVVSPGGKGHIGCEKCHGAAPHKESRINRHADAVACQTCHIPFLAKELPTKMSWDWSTAGKEIIPEPIDKLGKPTYDKKKGDFTWGKMVTPATPGTTARLVPSFLRRAERLDSFQGPA
jgi:hypothetical protein